LSIFGQRPHQNGADNGHEPNEPQLNPFLAWAKAVATSKNQAGFQVDCRNKDRDSEENIAQGNSLTDAWKSSTSRSSIQNPDISNAGQTWLADPPHAAAHEDNPRRYKLRRRSLHRMQTDHIALGIANQGNKTIFANREFLLDDLAAILLNPTGLDGAVHAAEVDQGAVAT